VAALFFGAVVVVVVSLSKHSAFSISIRDETIMIFAGNASPFTSQISPHEKILLAGGDGDLIAAPKWLSWTRD